MTVTIMLDNAQTVLIATNDSVLSKTSNGIWLDSRAVPTYLACFSFLVLALRAAVSSKLCRKLYSSLSPGKTPLVQDLQVEAEDDFSSVLRPAGYFAQYQRHVRTHGGPIIFDFQILRLGACFGLLSLSITTLLLEIKGGTAAGDLGLLVRSRGERWNNAYSTDGGPFTDSEWLEFALCITYNHVSFLGLVSISAKPRWSQITKFHLVLILLFTLGVYVYRDLYPLATFTLTPMDIHEGWMLWTKIGLLVLSAVVIPLVTPYQYIPVDPKDPQEPNPEQTASLLSFCLFSFLDPIIYSASKTSHLSYSQFPPLADYDYAENLVNRSFPYLDRFAGAKKGHIFWCLMRVFSREYFLQCFLLIVKVLSLFASPLGIKGILNYLETGGEDATVRPWAWIALLFLGPFIGSIAVQWFTFITSGILVRVEGILTQLIFEHSLRIRMKAEVASESSTGDEQSSVAFTDDDNIGGSYDSADTDGDETVGEPSTSGSDMGRAKDKDGKDAGDNKKPPSDTAPAEPNHLIGKINNLVTTDLNNLADGRNFLLLALYSPLQVALAIWFLYDILGWSALVGLLAMMLLFPIPGYIAKSMQGVQAETMKKSDARVQTVTETTNVLRMIKLFGWERKMSQRLSEKREEELVWLLKGQLLGLINTNINYVIPMAHMIVTFAVYTLVMKRQLSASIVFSSISVFDMLRLQLFTVFHWTPVYIQAKVSLDRVNNFLQTTELLDAFCGTAEEVHSVTAPSGPEEDVIGFKNATFSWSNEDSGGIMAPSRTNFRLRIEDELLFKRGCINLIAGPTGSGKTSLLMALLGEMHFTPTGPGSWFHLPREHGVAYASQESWVLNQTMKNNILFGAPYDEDRYNKVIYQCALTQDLTLFNAGDDTEVGEKGLTLSGGQKARVTLARAIYSSADILLLDDVLSALDVHTSKWIVENCLKGDLIPGRTVLIITHNVPLVSPVASFVVSLGNGGRVMSQSPFVSDALAKDGAWSKEVTETANVNEKAEDEEDQAKPVDGREKSDGKLILDEEIAEGRVSWSAIKMYLLGMGGNWPGLFWCAVMACWSACHLAEAFQLWFLGYWAQQYDNHPASEVSVPSYLSGYVLLLVFAVLSECIAYTIYITGSFRASRIIHRRLMDSVLGTTFRWLDRTPTSRVIARCTQDIGSVDGSLPMHLGDFLEITLTMSIKFCAVVIMTPIFIVPGVISAVLGGWLSRLYVKAQLSVKREMSNARAPVLAHFSAGIAGLTSIRAYGAEGQFKKQSLVLIDRYTRAARTLHNLDLWITLRTDALGALLAAGLAAYLFYGLRLGSASNTGFSLNMAVGFSNLILWWVHSLNEFEVDGNSLERIQQYINMEQEPKSTEDGVPPAYWPSSGDIRVEKLSARYSVDGPEVLHDISFHIKAGERVGVVGRTGSGKSSLTLSLLRCIPTEGRVYYDGIATDSINLDALRSNVTIIPQVPELLSGSVRQNVDPFSEHDDATLNDALRHAGLFSLQSADGEGRIGLDSQISTGGSNLSVGQRQILALARAIVRQSKILILDEATSAIDYETDSIIQSSLRTQLKGDVTVITVAHRLQTMMDADKIMVLDAGRVMEFGTPGELLEIENGMLRALVAESNDRLALQAMVGRSSKL